MPLIFSLLNFFPEWGIPLLTIRLANSKAKEKHFIVSLKDTFVSHFNISYIVNSDNLLAWKFPNIIFFWIVIWISSPLFSNIIFSSHLRSKSFLKLTFFIQNGLHFLDVLNYAFVPILVVFFKRENNTERCLLPFTYQVSKTHSDGIIPSELIVYRKLLLGWSDLSSLNESFWWGKAKKGYGKQTLHINTQALNNRKSWSQAAIQYLNLGPKTHFSWLKISF